MKTFAQWLEHNYNNSGNKMVQKLWKFQAENPNSSFREFWLLHGNNDKNDRELCQQEFYGMKNTHGQHVSAADLLR
ncbi:MAG: hypothetical protein M0R80_02105 [Proteobacteria bacterium]|jgi:hypothetical protein|nr:hypothetical protein [Pseudomonadota bacterium]